MNATTLWSLTAGSLRTTVLVSVGGTVVLVSHRLQEDFESDLPVAGVPRGVELEADHSVADHLLPYCWEAGLTTGCGQAGVLERVREAAGALWAVVEECECVVHTARVYVSLQHCHAHLGAVPRPDLPVALEGGPQGQRVRVAGGAQLNRMARALKFNHHWLRRGRGTVEGKTKN